MNFEAIEGLNEDNIQSLYSDIVSGIENEDNRLSACCCRDNSWEAIYDRSACISWCKGRRSGCSNWYAGYNASICIFDC